jgi:hypothetical protein
MFAAGLHERRAQLHTWKAARAAYHGQPKALNNRREKQPASLAHVGPHSFLSASFFMCMMLIWRRVFRRSAAARGTGRLLLWALSGALCAGCGPSSTPPASGSAADDATPQATAVEPAPTRTGARAVGLKTPANGPPLPAGTLEPEEWEKGWISLFDGATLYGWEPGSEADWRVEDGAIVVSQGEKGLLCTTTSFADYTLRLEFQADPQTNSGIFLRTPVHPTDPQSDCYELNIAPQDNPFPTGSFVGRQKSALNTSGEGWRYYEVVVQGGELTVVLDGKQVLHYVDPNPLPRGRIGLQLNEGRVAFRNIRLQPLSAQPLFDGKSLEGWKAYPEMASKFRVTPQGWINVTNGRGQLESQGAYADFLLQLECCTNAANLNSGLFFRCIPGEQMNGYECQIHNAYRNDRSDPVDAGTGAIFRRQPARIVAANDLEWFGMTVVADGPHMAVWVNGLQVTDWTDDREPHANPRNGRRLEAGTLMLQGHDPTTDVSFRNLRLVDWTTNQAP